MLEKMKERRTTVILSVLLCLVTLFGIYQSRKVRQLTYYRNLEYNRIFSELTEYVDDLEISLLKGQVVSTPDQMAKLSADLYTQASAAKANLSLLPIEGRELQKTSEFLSQVGEYANAISLKMQKGEKLTNEEIANMAELTKYADTLKAGLDEMLIGINEGAVSFDDSKENIPTFLRGGASVMSEKLMELEEEFHNYPSLIYDGPFSQHLNLKESAMLKGKAQISKKQAEKYAKKFTRDEKTTVSEINGKLPAFSVESASVTVEYTKQGGVLLMMMKDRAVDEEKINMDKAKKAAEEFLKDNGFDNMKESYYEKRDGTIVINYAYSQDGYIVFPDLVKVKVALDNGEVIGFESRGYVMNHVYRTIPEVKISREEALKGVNQALTVGEVTMAIIPLESGNEAPCYQIKGVVSGKHFLMYVNTQTGFTEDVQILLESENGTLAV